jgi:hypothetical protein
MAIYLNPKNKGKLHEETGTPKGQKIPLAKEEAALHSSDPAIRKRANFAINARKWNKK